MRAGEPGAGVSGRPGLCSVGGIVVSIAAFQAVDPGSIPGQCSGLTFYRAPRAAGRGPVRESWEQGASWPQRLFLCVREAGAQCSEGAASRKDGRTRGLPGAARGWTWEGRVLAPRWRRAGAMGPAGAVVEPDAPWWSSG